MNVVVVKYSAGNIGSVLNALERIGCRAIVSDDKTMIQSADKIILPGVGHARVAMNDLQTRGLDKLILNLKKPILGICIGMQLMCKYSDEGNTECLGIFDTQVRQFNQNGNLKVPHMGWNNIKTIGKNRLFEGLPKNEFVYYVHSYYADLCDNTIATTEYGIEYCAALQKENFYALQFHPEKSGDAGDRILTNFLNL
ncbi:MAG: imidazole glycerol phosphate synthase subunit HisH [Bacteroidales bacterium]